MWVSPRCEPVSRSILAVIDGSSWRTWSACWSWCARSMSRDRRTMATSQPETFRGLLLRHRGRTGLVQRDLASRAAISLRSLQEWEAGAGFPSAERLRGLVRALLEAGGFSAGAEVAEARELWSATERDAPRMHTPFDMPWFLKLLGSQPSSAPVSDVLERAQDWGESPDTLGFVGRAQE